MEEFISDIPLINPDIWISNEEFYKAQLLKLPNWKQIPLLNCNASHNLPDGALVRFKGMVQDMRSPEFYFEKLEVMNFLTSEVTLKCGKYRDTCNLLQHEKITNTDVANAGERHPYVIVSIPGFNEWAQKVEDQQNQCYYLDQPNTSKRLNVRYKRSLEEGDEHGMEAARADDTHKRDAKTLDTAGHSSAVSREHLLNFPLPDVPSQSCHVKIYQECKELKLNDLIEVVGFLSVDPALSAEFQREKAFLIPQLETEEELLTHNPPPSLIPRLHVVHYKKLRHCNPLIDKPVEQVAETSIKNAAVVREHLLKVLSEMMFGDTLAAEFFICYLISHVYLRQEALTVGQFCLNLSDLPLDKCPNYPQQLYELMKLMLTQCYLLPLTVENLNTMAFLPQKDFQCNRLTSGVLQLSRGTHLVLDETKMVPGCLDNAGVTNMAAIASLITTQKVEYNYKFFVMPLESDIPILILSEGKSLLPSEFYLPLKPEPSTLEIFDATTEAVKHYLKEDILNEIRIYLTSLKFTKYTISENIQYVEDDFVEMRTLSKEMSEDDLHRLLVLSRLIGLSRGIDTLTKECWDIAKKMENDRVKRVAARKTSHNEI